ncbi:MAG TPA: hypothetical protein VKQ32_05045 [Polyangia bacterium]|nr:hypothetical protein [Polyangia bacterium]
MTKLSRIGIAFTVGVGWSVVGCSGGALKLPWDGGGGVDAAVGTPVVISTTNRRDRTTTLSVNYWQWAPTYGDYTTGTDALVAALRPGLMRVGGYNNDANVPDPFDDAQMDRAVAYARAIGAEPLIQVPRLANAAGAPSTADDAAAMVRYANVTKGYGLKYFSVGNEPDLYDSMGLPSDSTMPAIPGYSPADFCTATRAYVTAMKAVDPTIKIVGPDLAYKYQIGNGNYDWLSPILQDCGDLFDIVAIHRYPYSADQAFAQSAANDAAAFRGVVGNVRTAMDSAGYTATPLAITEMNVAYNATTCVHDASPGTVGSALWLADILGTSIDLDIWTSAIWNISDTQDWSLGMIGGPPAHQPRPEYWTYALYADHFGSTRLDPPASLPSGVRVYASRNAADDTTQLIVVNWGAAPAPLHFEVSGLATEAPALTYSFPAMSLGAVEMKDGAGAFAWTYGETQRQRGVGPEPLPYEGEHSGGGDAGAGDGGAAGKMPGTNCPTSDGGLVCPQVAPTTPVITSMGTGSGSSLMFGPAPQHWGSYSYAGPGQVAPTGVATSDGNGIMIAGGFTDTVTPDANYSGLGLFFSSSSCLDGSAYTGVKFDFAGDLGSCLLGLGASFSGDLSPGDDPNRGACPSPTAGSCYGPSADVTAAALAATPAAPTIKVPFASLAGGVPIPTFDKANIVTVQWQLSAKLGAGADGGNACATAFTVSNVSFY